MPEIIGENVDRLCTVEMRPQGMPRGQIHQLYEAARQKQQRPLTLLAAEKLANQVGKKDVVLVTTGAGGPPWLPFGETDGAPGAAAIARAVALGLGAIPVYVSEENNLKPIIAASQAAGVPVMSFEQARLRTGAAAAIDFPKDTSQAQERAVSVLDTFKPEAIVSLEKLGPNAKGEIHSVQGANFTAHHAKVQYLIDGVRQRDVLTVGIGDGGNEIGFGMITEDVRRISRFGAKCQCACGGGMATVTATDVLVVGAVSNWATYGIVTCLAYLLKDPNVLHDAATEMRVVEACTREGAADGMYLVPIPYVDGTRPEVQHSVVTMLHMILENGLKTVKREI